MPATEAHFLAGYDLRAVVDWVEVRVTFAGLTQPRHIRNRIRQALPHWGKPPYIRADTSASSRTARSFIWRVQDPASPDKLIAEVQMLRRPGDLPITESSIEIVAVEVALDAYPRTAEAHTRLAHTALHLWRYLARPPAGPYRMCRPKHDHRRSEAAPSPAAMLAGLSSGHTINWGDETGNHRTRQYVKTHDTINGASYQELPADHHRARSEITLAGDQVPFRTLADWRSFQFDKLAPWFALRRETDQDDRSPLHRAIRERSPIGRTDSPKTRTQHRRLTRADTAADTLANERIRAALRGLTRQQRGAKTRRRTAQHLGSAIGNSVINVPQHATAHDQFGTPTHGGETAGRTASAADGPAPQS